MYHLLEHKIKILKGDTTKITTQQYIKLNTGEDEIQHVNPGGPDNSRGAYVKVKTTQESQNTKEPEGQPSPSRWPQGCK